ncbi:MAG: hypothetical protein DWQ37_09130 [Planctomycetota bacterium]|nr:MAG: hypothetical protein DWQ37_09130 [Planctomycetota bacterium]
MASTAYATYEQQTPPRATPAVGLAGFVRGCLDGMRSALEWVFGTLTLIVALAIVATIPVVQLLSLGYLLETSGRVAREARLRDGFVGIRKAAQLGRIALGITILMIPLWIAAFLRFRAQLIDPASRQVQGWSIAVGVIAAVVLFQIVTGCLRGARIRHFLIPRPIRSARLLARRDTYARARDAVWDFAVGLRLPYYFWLGLRGFVGASLWLAVPISLLAVASRLSPPAGGLVGLLGGALMAVALLYLPFVQARFAAENRLAAMFELKAIRRCFARAPLAFLVALALTLALALPLYLLKIEIVPREAAWLPSLLFVVSIFPARLSTGWALARASRRHAARRWWVRWPARLAMVPLVAFYVFLVYFTQYLSWYGVWSLYEQHAFLVPAPFLGY